MSEPTLSQVLDQLATICRPVVCRIESSVPVCQNHYDDYMIAIDTIAKLLPKGEDKSVMLAVGVALNRAGANQNGVLSALRALGVIA